jgi:hypothetical protein
MRFHILSQAVRKAEEAAAVERSNKVNKLVEALTEIWGGTKEARQKAWNVATWRMRRGLSLDIKKVLP